MRNRIALGGARVFDQRAGGAGCGRQCVETERSEVERRELAGERARCGLEIELPLGQPPQRIGAGLWQRDARGFRDQHFGRAQPLELDCEVGRPDLGGAEMAGGECEPGHAYRLLVLPQREQYVVALVVEQCRVGQRAGCDDARDLALDRALRRAGIADLLADRDRFAEPDEPRQILLDRMVRHARHLDRLTRGGATAGERDIEQARGFFRIAVEQLVEIAHAVEQQHVGVLRLDAEVLLHHRRVLRRDYIRGRFGFHGAAIIPGALLSTFARRQVVFDQRDWHFCVAIQTFTTLG